MGEHFIHILPIIIIIFLTLIYRFRFSFHLKLLIPILFIVVSFHNVLMHFDHSLYDQLNEKVHHCCILPVSISVDAFTVEKVVFYFTEQTVFIESPVFIESYYSFYSRPPPSIS